MPNTTPLILPLLLLDFLLAVRANVQLNVLNMRTSKKIIYTEIRIMEFPKLILLSK